MRGASGAGKTSSHLRNASLQAAYQRTRGGNAPARRRNPCAGRGPHLAIARRMDSHKVFAFGAGVADGGRELVELLGGKGAHLAEMARLGLPVPPGFTIPTTACRAFLAT